MFVNLFFFSYNSILTSIISNCEVSVAKLFGGLKEEPLADRRKVFVHSTDRLDHLDTEQTDSEFSCIFFTLMVHSVTFVSC